MTYRIAHSLGTDAANRQMRQDGRTKWNEEDLNLAADTHRKHFPLCFELLASIHGSVATLSASTGD